MFTKDRGIPVLLAMVMLLGGVGSAPAVTIEVPADEPTIQAGIDAAQAGDTVQVAGGTYHEHGIIMKSGVWLRGDPGDPASVTVDAQGLGRVILCDGVDSDAGIEGFTMTGGFLDYDEGSARGGGIALLTSSPSIRNCIITGNVGEAGGGGCYAVRSSSVIENCVFSDNSGVDGGGIYLNGASPRIAGCTIAHNECLFWGGGIFCANGSSPAIVNCTLAHNSAHEGGGIWCVNECNVLLENSIVAYSVEGEGIFAVSEYGHESVVTIGCSDVYGNAGGNYGGTVEDQTGIHGNISADPRFCGPVQEGDYLLAEDSPCLPQNNECAVLMGANEVGCGVIAGAADGVPASSRSPWIAAYPNPFDAAGEIRFNLPRPSRITIRIFDPTGREVRDLHQDRALGTGPHAIRWDGRDDAGRVLPSGVYLVRLDAGNESLGCKVVLLGGGRSS